MGARAKKDTPPLEVRHQSSFLLRAPTPLLIKLSNIAREMASARERKVSTNDCAILAIRQFVEGYEKRSKGRNPSAEHPLAPQTETEWEYTYEWMAFLNDTKIPVADKETILKVLRKFAARSR